MCEEILVMKKTRSKFNTRPITRCAEFSANELLWFTGEAPNTHYNFLKISLQLYLTNLMATFLFSTNLNEMGDSWKLIELITLLEP